MAIVSVGFTCAPRKQLSRKSQRWGSAQAQPRACSSKKVELSSSGSSPWERRLPPPLRFYSAHLEMASARPGRGHGCGAGFAFLRVSLSPLLLLVGKVRHAIQSHSVAMATEAQREVGLGDRQVRVNQAVDDGLHLQGIIRMNLGAHGW